MATMNSVFNIYMDAEKFTPVSINDYTEVIERFLKAINKSENDITYEDVMTWKQSMAHYSSATIAKHITCVKTYFKVLNKYHVIDNKVMEEIDAPSVENKPKHYMSAEMVKNMIKACDITRDPKRNRAIILLYCSAGPRYSELTGVTLNQYVNMRQNGEHQIVITGKGKKERFLTFNPETCDAIDEYLRVRNDHGTGCDKLFLSERGNVIAKGNLNNTLKMIAKEAGIPFWSEVSNHYLRAACATIYGDNNVPVVYIRDVMGHSSTTTTNRYIRRNDKAVESTVMNMRFV